MKLIFIINNNRVIGGGEYAQFKYAQFLSKMNHEVIMFCGDRHFLSKELDRENNLRVYYKPTILVIVKRIGIGKLNKLWSAVYEKLVVRKVIKESNPDWIIGYSREASIQAVKLGKMYAVKVANLVFETPPWMDRELGKRWQEEWRYKRFRDIWEDTKKAYQQSTVLIPNSKLSQSEFHKWLPGMDISEPVYPGIDTIKTKKQKKVYDIIYVGRLSALKNIDDIFIAVSELKERNLSVVVIGTGEQEQYLKKLARTLNIYVLFTGSVTDDEKFNFLSKSRLMVFPSSFEGFGMPPLEALVCGCPVICSDIPIFKEIYSNEVDYFALHDTKALAKLIQKHLSSEIELERKNYLQEKYSWKKSAITIENILKARK